MNMNPEPLGTNYDVRVQYQTLNPFKKCKEQRTLTSGGALSMSSNRTSLPVITATARAPGCGRVKCQCNACE